jgi:hypothetical protein
MNSSQGEGYVKQRLTVPNLLYLLPPICTGPAEAKDESIHNSPYFKLKYSNYFHKMAFPSISTISLSGIRDYLRFRDIEGNSPGILHLPSVLQFLFGILAAEHPLDLH